MGPDWWTKQPSQISINVAIRLTNQIMEGLTQVDLRAAYSNCIIAHPFGIVRGVDFQYSGKVERVDVKLLELFPGRGDRSGDSSTGI